MKRIIVVGAKGGVGTTTVACALAGLIAPHRPVILNGVSPRDIEAVVGAPTSTFGGMQALTPSFHINGVPAPTFDGVLVYDAGVVDLQLEVEPGDTVVLVVRNDYLALRRALHNAMDWDHVVAIIEEKRALDAEDIGDVLGHTPIVVEHSEAVARAVDGGLLVARLPRALRTALMALSQPHATIGG